MQGEVQVGTWVTTLRTPQIAQMVATAGFDFLYIDMSIPAFRSRPLATSVSRRWRPA